MVNTSLPLLSTVAFVNKTIDKKELKKMIAWAFSAYGAGKTSYIADKLKELGFHYATKAGISISIEDLRVPPTKKELLFRTNQDIELTEQKCVQGNLTIMERFQKVIDIWNNATESLKDEVIKYFKETDPLNPIYIMASSGSRGGISQVKQLVGMRGLMSDPDGQLINLPIRSNFKEGLTVTEYVISCYGARKGLVDTALRTADSGYLTRRLVDVAQDMLIREVDCGTTKGITLRSVSYKNKIFVSLKNRLLGRILFETFYTPDEGVIFAHNNQALDSEIAKKIFNMGIHSVFVRSPLTCESSKSICQLCYGWSLAHGSLVDLGEAVGIIAAQSIGEPGTQLTMRTFHTGGVFSGELSVLIRAPFNGVLRLPTSVRSKRIRMRHGEEALLLEESVKIELHTFGVEKRKMELKRGTILFINDNSQFTEKQVISEISPVGSFSTEKVQVDLPSMVSGEVNFSTLFTEEKLDKQGNTNLLAPEVGLLWVLEGDVYDVPANANIVVTQDAFVKKNETLATVEIVSEYEGVVQTTPSFSNKEVQIIKASTCIENAFVKFNIISIPIEASYSLEFENGDEFLMHCSPGNKLRNLQTIAELMDHSYCTRTGGILKYSNAHSCRITVDKQDYEVIDDLTLYWIPEETHHINKDISLLMVCEGQMINEGCELVKDLYSVSSGYLSVIVEGGIAKEILIKPGYLKKIESENLFLFEAKIFEAGENIYKEFKAQHISFVELVQSNTELFFLIRPVYRYFVKHNNFCLEQMVIKSVGAALQINVLQKILFKDGEKIKSSKSITLLKTCLVLNITSDLPYLSADVEFFPTAHKEQYQIRFLMREKICIKKDIFRNENKSIVISELLVNNGEIVAPGSKIAHTRFLCATEGQVKRICSNKKGVLSILILTEKNKKNISICDKTPQISKGEFVYHGDQLAEGIIAPISGKIFDINSREMVLWFGRPYLLSSNAILQVNDLDLIHVGDILSVLVFEKPKTGDIIQGLPKIEEILEARKPKESCVLIRNPGKVKLFYNSDDTNLAQIIGEEGVSCEYIIDSSQKFVVSNGDFLFLADPLTDGAQNPHEMLNVYFNFYKKMLPLYEASKISLQKIQVHLIQEVQRVYQSQSIDIADKHIEVIVKQMTSKVRIESGGDTTLLPGELIDLQQVTHINTAMLATKGSPATYSPMLLGITKSSLNTDSFISAASFQETTRILTEAAIEGKADWLRGLKENVIIGRLIPAGTGFNSHMNFSNTKTL